MTLAHLVVEGAEASRTAYFLHGILGSGRNWRGFVRALADKHPTWRFVLPDLRNHGDSPALPPPHTIAACAADLSALAREIGPPEVVVGHSFGSKVALAYAAGEDSGPLRAVAVLDAWPGRYNPSEAPDDSLAVIRAVRETPVPAPSREAIRAFLRDRGLPNTLVAWLLTSTRPEGEVWTWKYNIDGVEAMIADFFQQDFVPFLGALPPELQVTVVQAARGERIPDARLGELTALPRVTVLTLPDAGHWLHVDNPGGLMRLLEPLFA